MGNGISQRCYNETEMSRLSNITNYINNIRSIKKTGGIITPRRQISQYAGKNLFFDILPDDIIQKIYIMRIDNILNAKKKYLLDMIHKLPKNYMPNNDIPFTTRGELYYDPYNMEVYSTIYNAIRIITYYDTAVHRLFCEALITSLMQPIERGLMLYQSLTAVLKRNSNNSKRYRKMDELLANLTDKLYTLYRRRPGSPQ